MGRKGRPPLTFRARSVGHYTGPQVSRLVGRCEALGWDVDGLAAKGLTLAEVDEKVTYAEKLIMDAYRKEAK